MSNKSVKITWVRSTINRKDTHRLTLRALGLNRLQQSRVHTLTPQIEGMLRQVGYLCRIEPAN